MNHPERTLDHLARIGEHNHASIQAAAHTLMSHLQAGGLICTAGAGHSLAGVLETFYRAGGLAAVRPLHHPDLLPLHGAMTSTRAERRSGLAIEVLAEAEFRGGLDALVVFSHSGINPYPVELAMHARRQGSPVVAITSTAAGANAPRRAASTLAAEADLVLDTLVPAGDTTYPEQAPVTAPLSTMGNTYVWNLLLVALHDAATASGTELPMWRSANVEGGDEANAAHLDRYGDRVPGLR